MASYAGFPLQPLAARSGFGDDALNQRRHTRHHRRREPDPQIDRLRHQADQRDTLRHAAQQIDAVDEVGYADVVRRETFSRSRGNAKLVR